MIKEVRFAMGSPVDRTGLIEFAGQMVVVTFEGQFSWKWTHNEARNNGEMS